MSDTDFWENLFYFKHRERIGLANFGDDLNPWLFSKLLHGISPPKEDVSIIGIGTLINDATDDMIPQLNRRLVFSSGVGYGDRLPTIDERWRFYAVRGKVSRDLCRLPPEVPLGDGAILLSDLVQSDEIGSLGKGDVIFVPHIQYETEASALWRKACEIAGIRYVAPSESRQDIISSLANARLVITSAMHAAIVADTFRTPWVAVHTEGVLSKKWEDWGSAIGVEPRFNILPRLWIPNDPVARIRTFAKIRLIARKLKMLAQNQGQLSSDSATDVVKNGLWEAVDRLRTDIDTNSVRNGFVSTQNSSEVAVPGTARTSL